MFSSSGSGILRTKAAVTAVAVAGLLALPVQAAQAAPLSTTPTMKVNGTPATIRVTRPGASVKETFRGSIGERVAEVLTNVVTSDDGCETVTLYNPSHGQVDSGSSCGNGNDVGVGRDVLTGGGIYTVKVTLDATATGSAKLWVSAPVNQGAIVVNKAAQVMAFKRVGQGLERSFTGSVGELASTVLTNVVTSDDGCETVYLIDPNGNTADSSSACGNGNNVGVGPYPITVPGTWTVLAELDTAATGTAKLWLSKPLSLGTVGLNQPPVPMNVTRVGQGVERTFGGRAGQNVTAVVNGINTTDDGCATVTVLTSSGTQVSSGSACGNGNPVSAGPAPLPARGNYTVLYQVDTTATGTGKLTVST